MFKEIQTQRERNQALIESSQYNYVFLKTYSSLNMLKEMPVELIKIDMLFLRETEMQSRMSVILRNMIRMVTELGLVPLTEGVETEEQHRMLEQMGCKLFQGYLFAKPMPVEQFEETYLKNNGLFHDNKKWAAKRGVPPLLRSPQIVSDRGAFFSADKQMMDKIRNHVL